MKRSECTVKSLKALGYKAMQSFNNCWRFGSRETKEMQGKRADEVFQCVVDVTRNGGHVEIRRNNRDYCVNVFIDLLRKDFRGTEIVYYLSRPMTEAEKLEADLYTGRNK